MLIPLVLGALVWIVLMPRIIPRKHTGPLAPDLDAASKAEVKRLLAEGQKRDSVQVVRKTTGWPLVDSLAYINSLQRGTVDPLRPQLPAGSEEVPAETIEQVRLFVDQGKVTAAVAMVREEYGWSRGEAHAYVRHLLRD